MLLRFLAFTAILAAGAASAQTGGLEVSGAWARATPGKSATGAAYLTILSPTADRLVAASTPVATKAELHTMTMLGKVMEMRPVAGLDIPPGRPVTLSPGGMHIMLTGLKQPLREGQSFALTLTFAEAGTRTLSVAVEKLGAMAPPPAPQHQGRSDHGR